MATSYQPAARLAVTRKVLIIASLAVLWVAAATTVGVEHNLLKSLYWSDCDRILEGLVGDTASGTSIPAHTIESSLRRRSHGR